jgi:small GTP-binding protein
MTSGSRPSKFDFLIPLLLIGDTCVGKSSLIVRFDKDEFHEHFLSTIGIDFRFKTVQIGKKRIKLQIWDSSGQDRFHTITTSFFRRAMGVLLVYDVTCRETFDHIHNWMGLVDQYAPENVNKVLIGTKSDMETQRKVHATEGEAMANRFGIKFFEASSKLNQNVHEPFFSIVSDIAKRLEENPEPVTQPPVKLGLEPEKTKKKCCRAG